MGQLSSFVRSPDADESFGTPRLTLTLEGKSFLDLYLDTSYLLIIRITRDEDDPQTQPCIIHWDPIIEEEVPPLPPSPAPILASSRMSGAPVFSLTIAGPATLSMRDRNSQGRLRYPVTMTLSYDAAPDGLDGKPVTFHTFIFKDIDNRDGGFSLYFRRKGDDDWSSHELPVIFTYHMYRFSECVPVNVGRNERDEFAALASGESWSFTREVTDFPKNAAPGDEFRYRFKGTQLDWWDWGHLRDHENTVVGIEYIVRDPKDNGGRPGLVVPASNWVEVTVIE